MNPRTKRYLIIATAFIILATLFYYFGLHRLIRLETIKAHEQAIRSFIYEHYTLSVLIFIGVFAFMIAFSLPIVAPLTIIGGYIFGLWAIAYSLLATTLGGTMAFIIIRSFIGKAGARKYKGKLQDVERSLQRNGVSYLLMLQFLSIVPFFIINLAAIMADFSVWTMIWTTIVGSTPFVVIYAFIGYKIFCFQCVQDIPYNTYVLLVVFLMTLALIPLFVRRLKRPR